MISIIICSINPENLKDVTANITNTIGIEHEIISIDNRIFNYSISQAYNYGASKSHFEFLCFVHEDVLFKTYNWGLKAIAHFSNDKQTGVIGVAGSIFKTKMLSSWWQPTINGLQPNRYNILQNYKHIIKDSKHLICNPNNEIKSNVASLDGVFLFVRKKVWSNTMFDANLLRGFHAYDLDFTLNVGRKLSNYVVYDILIEHFSEGVNDLTWLYQNLLVHKKYAYHLPVVTDVNITSNLLKEADKYNLETYLQILRSGQGFNKKLLFWLVAHIIYSRLFTSYFPIVRRALKIILKVN